MHDFVCQSKSSLEQLSTVPLLKTMIQLQCPCQLCLAPQESAIWVSLRCSAHCNTLDLRSMVCSHRRVVEWTPFFFLGGSTLTCRTAPRERATLLSSLRPNMVVGLFLGPKIRNAPPAALRHPVCDCFSFSPETSNTDDTSSVRLTRSGTSLATTLSLSGDP